jgi:hypothetical protein
MKKLPVIKPVLGWECMTVAGLIELLNTESGEPGNEKHKIPVCIIEYGGEVWKIQKIK